MRRTATYPDNIALSTLSTDLQGAKHIRYFCPQLQRWAWINRKCQSDHEFDQRHADCQLLMQVAIDYHAVCLSSTFIHQDWHDIESRQMLAQAATALKGMGPFALLYQGMAPYSPELLNIAAASITLALSVIGEERILNPMPGQKQLCAQLRKLAAQVEQRYEQFIYNDVK